jgi:hypothetical protein
VCVSRFGRSGMSGRGVLMRLLRVLVSLDCVLMGSFVVALFVVLSGFVVRFVCH